MLKPGGRLLAFGSTRTYDLLVIAIRFAGFVPEDTVCWLYGSGFPKHKSKLKPAHEPIVVAWKPDTTATPLNIDAARIGMSDDDFAEYKAKQESFKGKVGSNVYGGNALLPSRTLNEYRIETKGRWPANVALTHHESCQEIGTKRVKGTNPSNDRRTNNAGYDGGWIAGDDPRTGYADADGRETVTAWDCHESCPVYLLDQQSGERRAGERPARAFSQPGANGTMNSGWHGPDSGVRVVLDTGGASRFFYCAKSSRAERNAGLAGLPEQAAGSLNLRTDEHSHRNGMNTAPAANGHPTVKPIALMAWLIRLIAKPGDTVLDPFCGSGSTGCAAVQCGVTFVGIEIDPAYLAIAERRIAHWTPTVPAFGQIEVQSEPSMTSIIGMRFLPRCPEHGEKRNGNVSTYRCGCKYVFDNNAHLVRHEPTITDLPLFASVTQEAAV